MQNPYRSGPVEKLCQKRTLPKEISRQWFAGLLWRLFPSVKSENELADFVAERLNSDGLPTNPRTVRNWLRGDHAPAFDYVVWAIRVAGPEAVFDIIDAEAA
ncbi:MAG: hypothetical protein COB08_000755 [Rhodobacteraceae bacterium]|nr:hypothetical protein [Paracoccaceae bacterium]